MRAEGFLKVNSLATHTLSIVKTSQVSVNLIQVVTATYGIIIFDKESCIEILCLGDHHMQLCRVIVLAVSELSLFHNIVCAMY